MRRDRRAVVFDLDDTLYPYRRFGVSGFAAVADYLDHHYAVDARAALRLLVRARLGPSRGREVQACLAGLHLPVGMAPVLVDIMRGHHPRLKLTGRVRAVLAALRTAGWRIGVLTNGPQPIQARKVSALGLARLVDSVVYAAQYGSGAGKPEPQPFAEIARRLDVPASRIVFVGDDERCDIGGATAAGMVAVRCTAWGGGHEPTAARAVTTRLADIPFIAESLLPEVSVHHAA